MNIKNVEFKAKVDDIESYEKRLLALKPRYHGEDHQIDTYFNVKTGRLKLREGNIENSLIQYDRPDVASSKLSNIILYQHDPNPALKEILKLHHGIKVVVDKIRKIYFIDNVKFHFDNVKNLGTYIEVEAIDMDNSLSEEYLKQQCDTYYKLFDLAQYQISSKSYSDLLLSPI